MSNIIFIIKKPVFPDRLFLKVTNLVMRCLRMVIRHVQRNALNFLRKHTLKVAPLLWLIARICI